MNGPLSRTWSVLACCSLIGHSDPPSENQQAEISELCWNPDRSNQFLRRPFFGGAGLVHRPHGRDRVDATQ